MFMRTLRGIPGMSSKFLQTVDVAKVGQMTYNRRLFRIFDREYPYTFRLNYRDITTDTSIAPAFVGARVGFTVVDKTYLDYDMTYRYKTEADILVDMKEIQTCQTVIKNILEKNRIQAEKELSLYREKAEKELNLIGKMQKKVRFDTNLTITKSNNHKI